MVNVPDSGFVPQIETDFPQEQPSMPNNRRNESEMMRQHPEPFFPGAADALL
jgi:hypothetical protein